MNATKIDRICPGFAQKYASREACMAQKNGPKHGFDPMEKNPGICIFLASGCVQDHRDCMNASMRSTAFKMLSVDAA